MLSINVIYLKQNKEKTIDEYPEICIR